MAFRKVLAADKLPEHRVVRARLGVRPIGLYRDADTIYAFNARCPHAGGPLTASGVKGVWVRCPRHAWRFRIDTGACPEHPEYELRTYEARERDGWVEVREDEEIW